MHITRNAHVQTVLAPSDWATGTLHVEPIAATPGSTQLGAAAMRFAPGARTVWHTHPLGQAILVTDGVGLCQRRGDAVQTVRAGDAITFGPGEDHWHGATPDRYAGYIDIQQADESGSPIIWGEPVTDQQYGVAGAS
jgi:quercetin dioxygenase-like cupin family protein